MLLGLTRLEPDEFLLCTFFGIILCWLWLCLPAPPRMDFLSPIDLLFEESTKLLNLSMKQSMLSPFPCIIEVSLVLRKPLGSANKYFFQMEC